MDWLNSRRERTNERIREFGNRTIKWAKDKTNYGTSIPGNTTQ